MLFISTIKFCVAGSLLAVFSGTVHSIPTAPTTTTTLILTLPSDITTTTNLKPLHLSQGPVVLTNINTTTKRRGILDAIDLIVDGLEDTSKTIGESSDEAGVKAASKMNKEEGKDADTSATAAAATATATETGRSVVMAGMEDEI